LWKSTFTSFCRFATLPRMLKKILPLLVLPLLMLMGGCATTATFTNLTPRQQVANANNLYPVEVAFNSRQQTLRWDSIKPQIVVGSQTYPMRPTPLMSNRWEGLVPVPAGTTVIHYQYKFDYLNNAFGPPQPDSARSAEYTLRIVPSSE
jgi:hypothetical protein